MAAAVGEAAIFGGEALIGDAEMVDLLGEAGKAAGLSTETIAGLSRMGATGAAQAMGGAAFASLINHLTATRSNQRGLGRGQGRGNIPESAVDFAFGGPLAGGSLSSSTNQDVQNALNAARDAADRQRLADAVEAGTGGVEISPVSGGIRQRPGRGAAADPPTEAGEDVKEEDEETPLLDVDAAAARIAAATARGATEDELASLLDFRDVELGGDDSQAKADRRSAAARAVAGLRGALGRGAGAAAAGVAGAAAVGGGAAMAAREAARQAMEDAGISKENARRIVDAIRSATTIKSVPDQAGDDPTPPKPPPGPNPPTPDPPSEISKEPLLRPEFMQDNANVVEETVQESLQDLIEFDNFDKELRRPPEASDQNPLWNDVERANELRFAGDLQLINHTQFGTGEGAIGAIIPGDAGNAKVQSAYDRDKSSPTWEYSRKKTVLVPYDSIPPVVSDAAGIPSDSRYADDDVVGSYFKIRPSERPGSMAKARQPFMFSNEPLPTVYQTLFPDEKPTPFNDVFPQDTFELERLGEQPLLVQPIYH
jgi:hypothetical protein